MSKIGKLLNEADYKVPNVIPVGFYVVTKNCNLSLSLKSYSLGVGELYQISKNNLTGGKVISQYNPLKKEWMNSTGAFITDDNSSMYDQDNRDTFKASTKSITQSEVDKLIKDMSKEQIIRVKDIETFIKSSNLKPNDRIKITII